MDIFVFTRALKKAVYDELKREFSFGCVNFKSQGSHPDMTYKDFIVSINVITRAFEATNWDDIRNFHELRQRGFEIEREMLNKTCGKNTYKGLVFLSIILASALIKTQKSDDISQFIKDFSRPLSYDYQNYKNAIFYKNLGLRDVRTFPLRGFEEIFELSRNTYHTPTDDLLLTLYLIANVDDTTTVNRSSLEELRFLQGRAKEIYNSYDVGKAISKEVSDLNSYYLKNQISSGGVADIFTLTKTLYYLREDL